MTKQEKKQEKKNKVLKILKWVFAGVGWTALLTAFIGLTIVGCRGCSNKRNDESASTPVVRSNDREAFDIDQPQNVVTTYNGNTNETMGSDNDYAIRLEVMLGANYSGTSYREFYWDINQNDPHNYARDTGNLKVHCNRAFGTLTYEDYQENEFSYRFDTIQHDSESLYIQFYLNGVLVHSMDERNWSQASFYNSVYITFDAIQISQIEGNTYDFDFYLSPYGVIDGVTYENAGIDDLLNSFMIKTLLFTGNYPVNDSGLTGVFGLLSNAFTAIANIFSINVVPGITLGTFIILPVVLMVVLFVVHLYKR